MSRADHGLRLRVPDGLIERIKHAAGASGRSMNAEIVQRLEASFEASRQLNPAVADLLGKFIDAEVQRRLQEIAAKIGGAS